MTCATHVMQGPRYQASLHPAAACSTDAAPREASRRTPREVWSKRFDAALRDDCGVRANDTQLAAISSAGAIFCACFYCSRKSAE